MVIVLQIVLKIIPINISGNKTYFQRIVCDRISALSNPKVSETYMVGYTKGIPANEVEQVRQDGLEFAEKINEEFEKAFQVRSDRGSSFKLMDIEAFIPQVIGQETDLIKVEKEG